MPVLRGCSGQTVRNLPDFPHCIACRVAARGPYTILFAEPTPSPMCLISWAMRGAPSRCWDNQGVAIAADTSDLITYGYRAAGPAAWIDPEGLRVVDTAQALSE